MIANHHECTGARRTSSSILYTHTHTNTHTHVTFELARVLCKGCLSHDDRERTVTPVGAIQSRKKKPIDGYLNAAVCMRVRYVAAHRELESKLCGALRGTPVWKCSSRAGSRGDDSNPWCLERSRNAKRSQRTRERGMKRKRERSLLPCKSSVPSQPSG